MRFVPRRCVGPRSWLALILLAAFAGDAAAAEPNPVFNPNPARVAQGSAASTDSIPPGLEAAANPRAPRALWQFDPLKARGLGPDSRPGVHPIQFENAAIEAWQPGESGELALPDGRVFEITAERVEAHSSGNRSWIGKFHAAGRTYVAVLTYGPAGVAGEVRTPDGPLLLTTEHGEVTLVDTAQADMRMPQPIDDDIRIPAIDPAAALSAGDAAIDLKATPTPQTTIDVLIAYSQGMITRHGSTAGARLRLDQLIATSNQAYAASEVAITLRLAHAIEVAYTDANDNGVALDDLSDGTGVFASVQGTLRTRYGADIVVLVRPFNYPSQSGCGVAWIGGYNGNGGSIGSQSSAGFAVVSDGSDVNNSGYFCQNATFPHELGHLMGAMHDRGTVTHGGTSPLQVGAYSYSYGYVRNATFSASYGQNLCNAGSGSTCFGTVMSYLNKVSELKFSNPNVLTCATGFACGTTGDNVALTLNNTRAGVASWRATKVPFVGATTGSGQSAQAGASFAQPLRVTIRDATNAVVPGVTVNFTVPGSGASATLSATSAVTDANGIAQVTATANGVGGSYTVTATAMSGLVAAPFAFNLTNASATSSLSVIVNGTGTVTGGGLSCPGTCASNPANGSLVTLSAAPGSGMVFTGWLGQACTGTGSCSITVNGAASVSATFAPSGTMPARFDIDLSQNYDALTDGLLIVRHLFGITGSPLTNGAVGSGAQRSNAAIQTFLTNITPQLDIDGNGQADALTDGMLVVRYLFGLRGSALITAAVGSGATRSTAAQIEAYIASRLP